MTIDPDEAIETNERTATLHKAVMDAQDHLDAAKEMLKAAKERLATAILDRDGHLLGIVTEMPLFDREGRVA
jgi:hypothetical protein